MSDFKGELRETEVEWDSDFERVVRAHLAPVFIDFASRVDADGIPFSLRWRWEAAVLARQHGLSLEVNAHFGHHYRGGVREGSLAIHDRLSVVLRSAYLRALTWARNDARLEPAKAALLATKVGVMGDPAAWMVRPVPKPRWWLDDPGEVNGVDRLAQAVGAAVHARLQAEQGGEVLAYAAGPIGSRERLYAELTIRAYLQASYGPLRPPAEELGLLPEVECQQSVPAVAVLGVYEPTMPYAGFARDWLLAPLSWRARPTTVDWLLPQRGLRGLHIPASWLTPTSPPVSTDGEAVLVSTKGKAFGRYCYWHDELRERHVSGAGPRVGCQLLIDHGVLRPHLDRGATLCWTAELAFAQRGEYREHFDEPVMAGTWLIGGSRFMLAHPWSPP